MPEDQKDARECWEQENAMPPFELIRGTVGIYAHTWLDDFFVFYDTRDLKIMISTTFKNDGSPTVRVHDIGCGEITGTGANQLIEYFTAIAKQRVEKAFAYQYGGDNKERGDQ